MPETTWATLKIAIDAIADKLSKMPPPPVPDDTWAEKMNTMTHAVQSMQEQTRSRIEAEDQQMERDSG
jgi:hypothetical protein